MVLVDTIGWESVAKEGGLLERTQIVLLGLSGGGLAVLARRDAEFRGLHLLLAALIGFAFVREFNNHTFYMDILPRSWMKSSIALAVTGILLLRYRATLPHSIFQLFQRQSFLLYLFGFILVVLWAQVMAQEELLSNRQDRLLEEILESAGYFLICFGVFEEHLLRKTVVSFSRNRFNRDNLPEIASCASMASNYSVFPGAGWFSSARSILQRASFRAILILLFAFTVYIPAVSNGFIWDDDVMLTDNAVMKADDGLRRIWFTTELSDYFPLTSTSFWIEWRIWGLNAVGYNITNIILHALSGILLWRVLLRLKVPGPWIAAVLFTVHPVCVASVDWIAERKNTLSMVFYLGALLLYLKFESHKHTRTYWFALGTFLLALLSKTSVVVLPFVLLLCAWWQRARVTKMDVVRSVPFFVLSLILGLVTVWFQLHEIINGEADPADPWLVRVLGGTWALWFYLGKVLLPAKLSMIYAPWNVDPSKFLAYMPGLLWLTTLVIAWRFRQTWGKPFLFGLGYFTIALLPVLGFLHMDYLRFAQVADHLQYIALPGGITLFVGLGIAALKKAFPRLLLRPMPLHVGCAAWVLLLSVLTWKQSSIYADEETLWRDNIRNSPGSWIAHHNLADRLAELDRFEEAAHYYKEALRLEPDHAKSYNNLGNCFVLLGRLDDAVEQFLDAIQNKPELAEAHHNLGVALYKRKQFAEALDAFKKAIQLQPAYAIAYSGAGDAELQLGRINEALDYYFTAAKYSPDSPDLQYNIGIVLSARGETNAAIRHLQHALRVRPDHQLAQQELQMLLTSTDPQQP